MHSELPLNVMILRNMMLLLDGIGKNSCISRAIQCMNTGLSPLCF